MKNLLVIAMICFLSISCTKEKLRANKDIITEIRRPGSFTGVHSSGSTPVHIKYGTEYKAEVRGSSNLIPVYRTRIFNNTLNLDYDQVSVIRDDNEVFITMPQLQNISMSGSGEANIEGNFPDQQKFQLSISGSANVTVNDAFVSDEVSADISGSGNADLQHILSEYSAVRISGSGDAKVDVQKELNVRISGSGKVYYRGSPAIDSKISGSGKVVPL